MGYGHVIYGNQQDHARSKGLASFARPKIKMIEPIIIVK